MKPRNPIFYLPGMISLLVVPLLFTGFVYLKWYKNDYRVIELNYPPEGSRIDSIHLWGEQYYSFPKRLKYRDYIIDNQDVYNRAKFNILEKELQAIRHDTTRGIRLIYSNTARFEDYVHGINLCLKRKPKGYLLLNDTLWITGLEAVILGVPPPHVEPFCDTRYHSMSCVPEIVMKNEEFNPYQRLLINILWVFTGFVVLLCLVSLRKRYLKSL